MCENGVDCKERPVSVSCTSGRSIRFRNCSQGSLILDGQCRGEYLYCSDPMSKCCRKFILRNIGGAIDNKKLWLETDLFTMNRVMTPRTVQRVGECRNMLCDMWIKRDTEEEKNVR